MELTDPEVNHELPAEVEDLYRKNLITAEEIDPLVKFHDDLVRAAPQPRPGFQDQLVQRLREEFDPPQRYTSNRKAFRHPSKYFVVALAVVLMVGVGVVFAISVTSQQFITQDAGLDGIFSSGAGVELDLSQSVGDYTLYLEWAHTDNNRLAVGFTVSGFDCSSNQYAFCDVGVRLVDQNQREFPVISSQGNDDQATRSYLYNFDVAAFPPQLEQLFLQLEIVPYGVTEVGSVPNKPNVMRTTTTPLSEPLSLSFSLPASSEIRVLNRLQNTTDSGITITLRQVTISPSQTRIVICFVPPTPERNWTAILHLTADGSEVAGGGAVQPIIGIGESGGETCSEFAYNTAMYDYKGVWQLGITELVGFANSGNDQERIRGSWNFEYIVP